MERWSRAARPSMWTWIRLSDGLDEFAKINKNHAVELNLLCVVILQQNIPLFYYLTDD